MIPLMRHELAARRISLITYVAIAGFLVLMYTSMFPTVKEQAHNYTQLLNSLPSTYQKAFGINSQSFATLEGFLGVELFSLTFPLLVLLLAISRAGAAFAGEVERGTMRTLLSLPVSRVKIFLAKYLAGAVSVMIMAGGLALIMLLTAAAFGISLGAGRVIAACGLGGLFGLAILSVATFISTAFSDRGKVYMITGGLVLAGYVAHVVAGVNKNLTWLDKISAFHYFDGTAIMAGSTASGTSWLFFTLVTVLGAAAGLLIFRRRDIPAR